MRYRRSTLEVRPVVGSLLVGTWSQAVLVVSGVIVARALGPQDRGVLALAVLVPILVDTLVALGVPLAVTYQLSTRRASRAGISRRLRGVVLAQLVIGVAAVVVIGGAVLPPGRLSYFVALGFVALGASGLAQVYGLAVLQGEQRFLAFNVLRVLPGTLYVALVASVALLGVGSLNAFALAWIAPHLLVPLVTLGVAGNARLPSDLGGSPPERSELLSFGVRSMLGASSPVEQFRLDQLAVGIVLSVSQLGLYVVAASFTNLSRFLGQSVGMIAYPSVAAESNPERQLALARRYVAIGAAAALCVTVPLVLATPTLLPLLVGDEFVQAVRPAQILLCASVFATTRRLIADVSRGAGFPTWGTFAELATLVALPCVVAVTVAGGGLAGVATVLALGNLLGLVVIAPYLFGLRPRWPSRILARIGVPLAVTGGALALGAVVGTVSFSADVALVTLIAAAVTAGVAVRLARAGTFDIFDPYYLFAMVWLVLFVLRPARMLHGHELRYEFIDVSEGFPTALLMALLGSLSFSLGYELVAGQALARRYPVLRASPNIRALVVYSVSITVLGLGLYGLFVIQSGGLAALQSLFTGRSIEQRELYAESSAYLYSGLYLGIPASLLLIWVGLHRNRRRLIVGGALLMSPALLRVTAGGTRSWLLPMLMAVVMLVYLTRGRRPSAIATIAALVVVLGAGIVFLGQARETASRGQLDSTTLIGESVTRPDRSTVSILDSGDTEMLPLLALTAQAVPQRVPHTWGAASGQALIHWVPRLLWAAKPRPPDEIVTSSLLSDPYFGGSSRQFTPLLAFYLDLGLLGVAVGMLAIGIAVRSLYSYLLLHQHVGTVQLVFAATAPFTIVLLRGSVTDTITRLLFVLPPILVGLRLARPPRAERRPDTASIERTAL